MAISQTDVNNIAPELASLSAGEVNIAIASALARLDPTRWGTFIDDGTKWLAAHLLAVVHPELEQSTGREYKLDTPMDMKMGEYATTRCGRQFWSLQRRVVGPVMFVV